MTRLLKLWRLILNVLVLPGPLGIVRGLIAPLPPIQFVGSDERAEPEFGGSDDMMGKGGGVFGVYTGSDRSGGSGVYSGIRGGSGLENISTSALSIIPLYTTITFQYRGLTLTETRLVIIINPNFAFTVLQSP